jgi:hypothetical protein
MTEADLREVPLDVLDGVFLRAAAPTVRCKCEHEVFMGTYFYSSVAEASRRLLSRRANTPSVELYVYKLYEVFDPRLVAGLFSSGRVFKMRWGFCRNCADSGNG